MKQEPIKVRDVVELAVLRVRQEPGSFDPARLFLELDRDHRIEIMRRLMAEMPKGWAYKTKGSVRFARWIALKVEYGDQAASMAAMEIAPLLSALPC